MPAAPAPCRKAVTPEREGLVVAGDGMVTWEWLADLCAAQDIPFVLGPARYRQALQGGQAPKATRDSPKSAALRRSGMLPQASV